jgi:hypothetical protein
VVQITGQTSRKESGAQPPTFHPGATDSSYW